jgi:hypothetical protein
MVTITVISLTTFITRNCIHMYATEDAVTLEFKVVWRSCDSAVISLQIWVSFCFQKDTSKWLIQAGTYSVFVAMSAFIRIKFRERKIFHILLMQSCDTRSWLTAAQHLPAQLFPAIRILALQSAHTDCCSCLACDSSIHSYFNWWILDIGMAMLSSYT